MLISIDNLHGFKGNIFWKYHSSCCFLEIFLTAWLVPSMSQAVPLRCCSLLIQVKVRTLQSWFPLVPHGIQWHHSAWYGSSGKISSSLTLVTSCIFFPFQSCKRVPRNSNYPVIMQWRWWLTKGETHESLLLITYLVHCHVNLLQVPYQSQSKRQGNLGWPWESDRDNAPFGWWVKIKILYYPLVMTNSSLLKMAIEIVDFSHRKWWIFP